ncbi:hypothetical protein SCB29_33860 [Paraburkholderia sp. SIMBA_055]
MTAYAIIQHPDFNEDALPAAHDLRFAKTFWTTSQFGEALRDAITALHRLDDATPKVLIISTHGEELTGTRLDTGTGSVDLWQYKHCFGVLPNNLVVYVSACWGGYPSAAAAIQSGTRVPHVVGPLVDTSVSLADAFQTALLDLVDGGMPSTAALNRLIGRFNSNEKLRREHYGNVPSLFGMWDVFRVFSPQAAVGAQLAAPVNDGVRFKFCELVRLDESGEAIACVLELCGEKFQANVTPFIDAANGDPSVFIGAQFDASYQFVSDLEDSDNVRIIGLPIIHIVELL